MNGYNSLKRRVAEFLKENPEVREVTLARPAPPAKQVWEGYSEESFGRMPESCPTVKRILEKGIPDGWRLVSSEGSENAIEAAALRDTLFEAIREEVTERFRGELSAVCRQKHAMLGRIRTHARQLRDLIDENETEKPSEDPPVPRRSRSRQSAFVEIEEEEIDL